MIDLGTVLPGSTIRIPFSTFNTAGAAVTMTNFAVADILIYKDGSTTERASTAGFTATTDFDAKTGKQLLVIDLSDNTTADFYAAGSEYLVAIDSVTVDSQTVGTWVARFKIGYREAILDTTIATLSSQTSFTLTAGPANDSALVGCIVVVHAAASAVQRAIGVVSAYTGSTKTVTLAADPAIYTMAAKDNISFFVPSNTRFLAGIATGPTNLNTIFNTDYSTVYDTTNKALLSKLGNFAMGGSSLALTTGAISGTTLTLSGAVALQSTLTVTGTTNLAALSTSGTTTLNALTVTNATTFTGAISGTNASNDLRGILLQATQTGVTIPTVTNLTNAPTNGDLTATMKTSVMTAATAALAGVGLTTYVAPDNTTIASISSLTSDIDTRTQTIDSTTSGTSLAVTILTNRLGAFAGTGVNTVLGFFKAVFRADASTPSDVGGTYSPATGSLEAARSNIGTAGAGLTALGDVRLANLDTTVSSRLASGSYTAPDNTSITAIKAKTDNLPSDPASITNLTSQLSTLTTHGNSAWATAVTVGLTAGAISDASFTVPTVTSPATGTVGRIHQLWRRFFKRTTKSSTQIKTYADDGTTVVTTQAYTSVDPNDDVGAAT